MGLKWGHNKHLKNLKSNSHIERQLTPRRAAEKIIDAGQLTRKIINPK